MWNMRSPTIGSSAAGEYLYYDLGSRHLNIVPNAAVSDFLGANGTFSQTKNQLYRLGRPRPDQLQVLIPDRGFRNNGGKAYALLSLRRPEIQGLGLAPGRCARAVGESRGSLPSIWIAHYRACLATPFRQPARAHHHRDALGRIAGTTTDAPASAPRGVRTRTPSEITPPQMHQCAPRRFHRHNPLRRGRRQTRKTIGPDRIRASGTS